jgi:hypothetical protein
MVGGVVGIVTGALLFRLVTSAFLALFQRAPRASARRSADNGDSPVRRS